MVERCVGFVVVGENVTVVDTEIPDDNDDPITVVADDTWRLQKGDRAPAYAVLHQRCEDYLRENGVERVIVKASALPTGPADLAFLQAPNFAASLLPQQRRCVRSKSSRRRSSVAPTASERSMSTLRTTRSGMSKLRAARLGRPAGRRPCLLWRRGMPDGRGCSSARNRSQAWEWFLW